MRPYNIFWVSCQSTFDKIFWVSCQSIFDKPYHSTEMALLRVKNDITMSIDNKNAVFLVMLDLSAAFDTIDHAIFVNRLCHTFHIKGCAQKWFASYLQNRKNRVCISGEFSKEHILNFGLPQGSILGPRGYTMYTYPVGDILRRNNVSSTSMRTILKFM